VDIRLGHRFRLQLLLPGHLPGVDDLPGDVVCGLHQKVARAHSRVQNFKREQLFEQPRPQIGGHHGLLYHLIDQRPQGVLDDVLDNVLRRVKGAGGLPLSLVRHQIKPACFRPVCDLPAPRLLFRQPDLFALLPDRRHALLCPVQPILQNSLVNRSQVPDVQGRVVHIGLSPLAIRAGQKVDGLR